MVELQRVQLLLQAAEARANSAEARIAGMEKQLSLCRHSSATLRASLKMRAPPPPAQGLASNRTSSGLIDGRQVGVRCADSVAWASTEGIRLFPELYPGLNASSTPLQFQLHLHLYERRVGCPDPRDASDLAADDSAMASFLLFLGVVACALCNAYSLGYLPPNRMLRSLFRRVGIPVADLVR